VDGEVEGDRGTDREPRVERGLRVLGDELEPLAQPAQALAARRARSVSPKRRLPESASSSLSVIRAVVDLPQPDSPTIPTVSPGLTTKLTSSTARTPPP